jgi:hypothetical protein
MKTIFLTLIAAGLLLAGCGQGNTQSHSQATNASPTTTNVVNTAKPAGGYLGTLMEADKAAVKTIDVSYLNQAIQLFNTQEGRLPKDLNELVPNYVAKLPAAPYGYKIDYDAANGSVRVVKQ